MYDIRNTGGRRAVNWYRALETPTSMSDSSNPADQMTSSVTGETEANGASITEKDVGEGERGEYKSVGLPNPNYSYDNNKNVTADPTRTFKYNYRNQMRSAARKSDNGTLVEYMHDAGGREVWNRRHWYVGRHETLDTRFPLDVNLDADGNDTYMVGSDGGISNWEENDTSWSFEESNWPGRLGYFNNGGEMHYFDFQVYVPEYETDTYLGYVSYDEVTVHIFAGRVVLTFDRNDASPSALGYESESYALNGWHNIGISVLGAGVGVKIWIDGNDVITSSMGSPVPDAMAWFSCHRSNLSASSMAVHAFASYRGNHAGEVGVLGTSTSVSGRDGNNPSETMTTNFSSGGPKLRFAAIASTSTYLTTSLADELITQFALPGTRQNNTAYVSRQVSDGSSGLTTGVDAINIPSENGSPNLYRAPLLNATTISDTFTLPTDVGGESGPMAGDLSPGNGYWDGVLYQVIVNGSGTDFDFTGDQTDDLFALDRGRAGGRSPLHSVAMEDYGTCTCRDSSPNNQSNLMAYVENTGLGLVTDNGDLGDPQNGVMFTKPTPVEGGVPQPETVVSKKEGITGGKFVRDGDSVYFQYNEGVHLYRQKVKDPTKVADGETDPALHVFGEGESSEGFDFTKGNNLEEREWIGFSSGAINEAAEKAAQAVADCLSGDHILETLQTALDLVGMIPVVGEAADLANAAISAMNGDELGAALSALAAIPGVGNFITPIKAAIKLGSDGLATVLKNLDDLVSYALNALPCGAKQAIVDSIAKVKKSLAEAIESRIDDFCFTGETLVLTLEGAQRIEELGVGTLVKSWDEQTGEWTYNSVTAVSRRLHAGFILRVCFDDNELQVTGEHPIWVVHGVDLGGRPDVRSLPAQSSRLTAKGRWVAAKDLKVGDALLSADGSFKSVKLISVAESPAWVYNLTVSRTHTFSVTSCGLVVHNSCVGSYTITFANGQKYHGKGSLARAKRSAAEKARDYNTTFDPDKDIDWKPESNHRDAFKAEHKRIEGDGGPGKGNYNQRNSPGKKFAEQDAK